MMRTILLSCVVLCFVYLSSCLTHSIETTKAELSPEQQVLLKIDTLKMIAKDGDLLTRMNDNIISYHVKNMNDKDRSFSHAGVVMTINGEKLVCNIDANEKGLDTVRYDPIDSFLNPKQNFLCGLFRYDLPENEIQQFITELKKYSENHAHFDRVFDLETDSLVYCSEMISKSLNRATNGRMVFKQSNTPKQILPLLEKYFQKDVPKNSLKQTVKERKYISIDNLYLIPQCEELARFQLKHFPGE